MSNQILFICSGRATGKRKKTRPFKARGTHPRRGDHTYYKYVYLHVRILHKSNLCSTLYHLSNVPKGILSLESSMPDEFGGIAPSDLVKAPKLHLRSSQLSCWTPWMNGSSSSVSQTTSPSRRFSFAEPTSPPRLRRVRAQMENSSIFVRSLCVSFKDIAK